MLDVLVTVNTEFRPATADRALARDSYNRCVLGRHRQGAHGIGYQIEVLNAHGLKGVFFVETLHAAVVGDDLLARTIDMVRGGGHEVQLSLQTEWLDAWSGHPFAGRGRRLCDFNEDDQAAMIDMGLHAMARCGEGGIAAFRAGHYGADRATLRAVARCGLAFDASYYQPHLGAGCALDFPMILESPVIAEGVWEVPITHFFDRPRHVRPLQLCACSFAETSAVLKTARVAGRATAVLVSHSFELMNPACTRPDPVVVGRFGQLCHFLSSAAGDGIRTAGFNDLRLEATEVQALPIRSNAVRTGARMVEQMVSRLYQ